MKQYLIQKYNPEENCFEKNVSVLTEEEFFNYRKASIIIDIKINNISIDCFKKGKIINVVDKYKVKHKAKIKELSSIPNFNSNKNSDGYVVTYFEEDHKVNHFYPMNYLKKLIKEK